MVDLTKEEKLILVFFLALFIIGTGVNFYKKRFGVSLEYAPPAYPIPRGERGYASKINVNTANLNELIKLKGIGEKLATVIIDYRQNNGPFFYKEDLMKIKGIGQAKFNAIKDDIIAE